MKALKNEICRDLCELNEAAKQGQLTITQIEDAKLLLETLCHLDKAHAIIKEWETAEQSADRMAAIAGGKITM